MNENNMICGRERGQFSKPIVIRYEDQNLNYINEINGKEAGSNLDAETHLGEKSLISTSVINGSTYYRLLDTTRTYAAAKLSQNGESDRTSRQHAITYPEYLEHDDVIQSSLGDRDLAVYAQHIGNVRAALAWTLSDRGDIAVGIQLAARTAPLLIGLSLLEECRYWCDQAIAARDGTWRGTRQEMILQEALALSSMFTRGHSDQVRGAIERGLVLAENVRRPYSATAPSCRSRALLHAS